jgi:hypothetical protein
MSSPRTSAARGSGRKVVQPKRPPKAGAQKAAAAKPVAKSAAAPAGLLRDAVNVSSAALRLAADVERGLAAGSIDVLTPQAVQALMAAACNVYSAQVEAGRQYVPIKPQSVPPTAAMTTASGILKSANLAVFELGMWQSWTGR